MLYLSLRLLSPTLFIFTTICLLTAILAEQSDPEFTTGEAVAVVTSGWSATYGGYNYDWASSIRQTSDGGYIVVGFCSSFDVRPILDEGWTQWVLKLRHDGEVEWQNAYSGAVAESVQQTNDSGYIVAGARRSFSTVQKGIQHLYVLKLRADGSVEWQKAYGGGNCGEASSIQQTRDGGYIVAGWTNSFGAGEHDIWILKLGPDGAVEWQKTYGGVNRDESSSIQQTRDGGYIVAGWTRSFGAVDYDNWLWLPKNWGRWTKKSFSDEDYDAWVLKLRVDGTVEWQKAYGGANVDEANSVQQTLDGSYIVAGVTKSFGAGKTDFWALKLGPDGGVEWQKTYGGVNFDKANSIQQTSDEGYIVAGYTRSFGAGHVDFWVLKLGPDGAVKWQKTYGGIDWDEASSIQETHDGGYIVAGKTASFRPISKILDFWVLKLKSDGSISPSCNHFIRDTDASVADSNAIILDTSAEVRDSDASPQVYPVEILLTNLPVNILCH